MLSLLSRSTLLCLFVGSSLCAQEQGLTPEWAMRPILKEISAHAGRIAEILDKLDLSAWSVNGASESYIEQIVSSRVQARALQANALELSKDPEKLAPSLEAYFRMQSLEYMLFSLRDGIRKYQSAELADTLGSVASENGANRNRFQTYITELAADRERELDIMNHEAQRCRAFILSQPSGKKKTTGQARD
jgi:hypothetical protein